MAKIFLRRSARKRLTAAQLARQTYRARRSLYGAALAWRHGGALFAHHGCASAATGAAYQWHQHGEAARSIAAACGWRQAHRHQAASARASSRGGASAPSALKAQLHLAYFLPPAASCGAENRGCGAARRLRNIMAGVISDARSARRAKAHGHLFTGGWQMARASMLRGWRRYLCCRKSAIGAAGKYRRMAQQHQAAAKLPAARKPHLYRTQNS